MKTTTNQARKTAYINAGIKDGRIAVIGSELYTFDADVNDYHAFAIVAEMTDYDVLTALSVSDRPEGF